jgi:ABC-type uncharacterized transport system substrate-binding protein
MTDALIIDTDVLLLAQRKSIVEYAAMHRFPAVYGLREFVDDGGLISFGANTFELARLAAGYVDKILKGARPADLPIQQPTKFELVDSADKVPSKYGSISITVNVNLVNQRWPEHRQLIN